MGKPWTLVAALLCLANCGNAIAGGLEHDGSPDARTAAASNVATAVDQANKDLARRGRSAPDRAYLIKLQDAMARPDGSDAMRSYVATTDETLLNDRRFAVNLRRLFETHARAGLATVQPSFGNRFIVGGQPISSATDVVGLTGSDDALGSRFCSGIMITARRVLTAAHCVCGSAANFVRIGERMRDRSDYRAYPVRKRWLWLDQEFCPAQSDDETAYKGRDLAILEVEGVLTGGKIRPVLVPGTFGRWRQSTYGNFVRAAGYGFSHVAIDGALRGAGERLYADIAVAAPVCSQADASTFGCRKDRELVAAGHPAHHLEGPTPDTCGGDSGGPILALMRREGKLHFYLAGITSRGTSGACGSGGIYSLVTPPDVQEWLKNKGAEIE